MKLNSLILMIAAASFTSHSLLGGQCFDSISDYLSQLSSYPKVRPSAEDDRPLFCLRVALEFFEMDREGFADTGKLDESLSSRTPLRAEAERVLEPITRDKEVKVACAAAEALALFRSAKAFPRLVQCPISAVSALALGLSGDERAVPVLKERYLALDKRYKKRPRMADPERLSYLNAFFHLNSKEAVPFLTQLLESSRGDVRKRVQKVLAHITASPYK